MNVKRILVTTLAGGMLLGSIGVYASSIPAGTTQSSSSIPTDISQSSQAKPVQSSMSIKVEDLLEGTQELKGDLPTDEGMAERIENLDDTPQETTG